MIHTEEDARKFVLNWGGNPSTGRYRIANPEATAFYLRKGRRLDYEPGDGTRYEVELVGATLGSGNIDTYLIVRNLGNVAFRIIEREIDCLHYCSMSTSPVGSWSALRPLFAALHAAPGETSLDIRDRTREAEMRTHLTNDGKPLDGRDARIGRQIRRLVEYDLAQWGSGVGGESLEDMVDDKIGYAMDQHLAGDDHGISVAIAEHVVDESHEDPDDAVEHHLENSPHLYADGSS